MAAWRRAVRRIARSAGYDVVRFPPPGSHARHLQELLDLHAVSCVLDVGAHQGEFATSLRELGYAGRIVSFEPVRAAFARLERRTAGDRSWTAHRLALGAAPETRTIGVAARTHFSSFLPPSGYSERLFGPLTAVERRELVEIRRLDDELDRHVGPGEAVFLKIDTQGWDLEVLRGAERCLERIAVVQAEAAVRPLYDGAPSYDDVLGFLGASGFELTGVFPVDRDEQLRVTELDCVLARAPAGRGAA